MNKGIKEVYVGIAPGKDGKGNIVPQTIMFAGPNPFIPKGIYNEKNPPPGWAWERFLEKAIKHDGRGVVVVYEGADQPKIKAVMESDAAAAEKQLAEQAKVRDAMVDGRHPEKTERKQSEPEIGGVK